MAVLVLFLKHQESQLGAQLGNASVVAVLVRILKHERSPKHRNASVVGVLVLFIILAPLARVALRNLPNPKVKVDVPAATFFLSIL